jgi:uncharacterized protein (TIGR03437 family)
MRTLGIVFVALAASAQLPDITLHRVVTGLDDPTDIQSAFDGTGRLFVVEQIGRIRIVKNGLLLGTPFLDIRSKVGCCGERGLLGLAFPPQFASKRYFYINYTDTRGHTVVSRVRVSSNPDVADEASEQTILMIDQPFSNHNGGGLAFGSKDGFLYIGTGDGGSGGDPQNHGQRTDSLLGKMLRIDTESGASPYGVPPSNPFVNRTGVRPEIWATGLRNPWRYAFDKETGDLWIADVGQNRAEEVNFQPGSSAGGENYGWRRLEGLECYPANSNCDRSGTTLPILEYPRSSGCSVTGGKVYRGVRWPELKGAFLYTDYCSAHIWGVRNGGQTRMLLRGAGQAFSTFGEDENGELYLGDQASGNIFLITAGAPMTSSAGVVNAASFSSGISPGSLATLFGVGITSFSGIVSATAFPLPGNLAGTGVTLNGIPAPIVAVASVGGQEQINFQVPFELAGISRATLVISANGRSSAPIEVPIVPAQPEIFAVVPQGPNMTIYATGLGAVSNAPSTGGAALQAPLSTVVAPVEVRIGGVAATVDFAGLAPGFAGLYQINAQIPQGVSNNSEVTISVGGATSKPVSVRLLRAPVGGGHDLHPLTVGPLHP